MSIGVVTKANKKALFVMLVAQVPRPRDMVIFMLTITTTTMTTTTTRPITLPLAHARGVIIDESG